MKLCRKGGKVKFYAVGELALQAEDASQAEDKQRAADRMACRSFQIPCVEIRSGVEKRVAIYLPDLAGAETGADLEFSSTECEPPEERT